MTNDGKQFELLVQSIERTIAPDAIIEHDVDMPILNSKIGATTQCDIVVWTGKKPRQTITIFEIQDRSSKVKPNDFRGWKQKLKDVGAQHLICVSRHEFPKSIKEQASSGNSIKLMTLKEDVPENLPLNFINFHYKFTNFNVVALNLIQPSISQNEAISIKEAFLNKKNINVNAPCWSVDGQHTIKLYNLCRDYYTPPDGLTAGNGKFNFDLKEDPPLYYLVNDTFVRTGLTCEFEWTNEILEKPVSVLTYEQNEFGALAWVAEIIHESPRGQIVIRIPLIKEGNNYAIRFIYTELPNDVDLAFSTKSKLI